MYQYVHQSQLPYDRTKDPAFKRAVGQSLSISSAKHWNVYIIHVHIFSHLNHHNM